MTPSDKKRYLYALQFGVIAGLAWTVCEAVVKKFLPASK